LVKSRLEELTDHSNGGVGNDSSTVKPVGGISNDGSVGSEGLALGGGPVLSLVRFAH
jgi:hypothetical protein